MPQPKTATKGLHKDKAQAGVALEPMEETSLNTTTQRQLGVTINIGPDRLAGIVRRSLAMENARKRADQRVYRRGWNDGRANVLERLLQMAGGPGGKHTREFLVKWARGQLGALDREKQC